MHQTVHEGEDPSIYSEHIRQQYMENYTLVSEAPMTQTSLRDGLAYVLAHFLEVSYGEQTETVYGLLHGTSDYRLIFAIPSPYLDEYEDVFQRHRDDFRPGLRPLFGEGAVGDDPEDAVVAAASFDAALAALRSLARVGARLSRSNRGPRPSRNDARRSADPVPEQAHVGTGRCDGTGS